MRSNFNLGLNVETIKKARNISKKDLFGLHSTTLNVYTSFFSIESTQEPKNRFS